MWTWRRSRSSVLAAALVLASCATVPAPRRAALDAARFGLFSQGDVYFAFNMTTQVRSAASAVLPAGARPLLRRAECVYGAVGPGGLEAAAEGRFSPASVRTALALKAGWRRVSGSRDRWRAADGPLEAALPRSGLLLVGRPTVAALAERATLEPAFAMPPQAAAALANADLYGYSPAVPRAIAGGLPIRSGWAAFEADEGDRFRGELTLLLAGESDSPLESGRGGRLVSLAARALLTQLLRGAGVADYAARLRELSVQVDGPAVRVSGLLLSGDEIAAVVGSMGEMLR